MTTETSWYNACPLCRWLKPSERLICLHCGNDEYDAVEMLRVTDVLHLFYWLREVCR